MFQEQNRKDQDKHFFSSVDQDKNKKDHFTTPWLQTPLLLIISSSFYISPYSNQNCNFTMTLWMQTLVIYILTVDVTNQFIYKTLRFLWISSSNAYSSNAYSYVSRFYENSQHSSLFSFQFVWGSVSISSTGIFIRINDMFQTSFLIIVDDTNDLSFLDNLQHQNTKWWCKKTKHIHPWYVVYVDRNVPVMSIKKYLLEQNIIARLDFWRTNQACQSLSATKSSRVAQSGNNCNFWM